MRQHKLSERILLSALIHLRGFRFAAQRVTKLRLDHAERRFNIAPFVVSLHEPIVGVFAVRCCDYDWMPKDPTVEPQNCSKCKSPYWNTRRTMETAKPPNPVKRK